jgi:hypothetical protein
MEEGRVLDCAKELTKVDVILRAFAPLPATTVAAVALFPYQPHCKVLIEYRATGSAITGAGTLLCDGDIEEDGTPTRRTDTFAVIAIGKEPRYAETAVRQLASALCRLCGGVEVMLQTGAQTGTLILPNDSADDVTHSYRF